MPHRNFWSRLRKGRLVQVVIVYLGVSWGVLQVVAELREALALPPWISPVMLIFLLAGFVVTLATGWTQSHPLVDAREAADEVPRPWEVDVGDAFESVRRGRLPHLTWARVLVSGVVVFALLFGAVGLYVGLHRGVAPRETGAATAPGGIAVLPFAVRGEAIADWREGMVDLVSTGLDGTGGLRAIASRTVLARWHDMVGDDIEPDEGAALDVARRLGARYALLGTAVAIGPTVRVTVTVNQLDPDTARLGQVEAQGPADSVLALVDTLSLRTLSLLLRRDPDELPRVDLASVTTSSLPALKAYLVGESHFRRGEFSAAADALARAVSFDSTFGLAYYRLAQAYGWSESIASERGAEASARAMRLGARLPERVALLVRGDAATARGEPASVDILRQAVGKYPDDAEAWYSLGDAYLHVRAALYGWDEAEDALQHAAELAPRFAPYRIHLVDEAFRYYADGALVEKRLEALERLAPRSPVARRYRLAADLAFGDSERREAAYRVLSDSAGQIGFGAAIANLLTHPRYFDTIGERVWQLGMERAPRNLRPVIQREYAFALAENHGRLHDALDVIHDPSLATPQKLMGLFAWHALGLPVPVASIDSLIGGPATSEVGLLISALRAAERNGLQSMAPVRSAFADMADSLAAVGDTLAATRLRAWPGIVHGYDLWRAGRIEDAIRVLEANRVAAAIPATTWWLGLLHLQGGHPAEAVRYLRALMTWTPNPFAGYYLGQAYEAQGEAAKARQMLGFFVRSWEHADPQLQFMVDDARARLARLAPDRS